jgi:formylglycine-generating enzyme
LKIISSFLCVYLLLLLTSCDRIATPTPTATETVTSTLQVIRIEESDGIIKGGQDALINESAIVMRVSLIYVLPLGLVNTTDLNGNPMKGEHLCLHFKVLDVIKGKWENGGMVIEDVVSQQEGACALTSFYRESSDYIIYRKSSDPLNSQVITARHITKDREKYHNTVDPHFVLPDHSESITHIDRHSSTTSVRNRDSIRNGKLVIKAKLIGFFDLVTATVPDGAGSLIYRDKLVLFFMVRDVVKGFWSSVGISLDDWDNAPGRIPLPFYGINDEYIIYSSERATIDVNNLIVERITSNTILNSGDMETSGTPNSNSDQHQSFPLKPVWSSGYGKDKFGYWSDITISGVHQKMRWIPPGTFIMGRHPAFEARIPNSCPHVVTISRGFWMAETDCTQELWKAVMGNNPSEFTNSLENPVENLSWSDCKNFFNKINLGMQDVHTQFPTEAEWEYACRAGSSERYNGSNLDDLGWYNGNAGEMTHPVKGKSPNAWGLYDMHGNIEQWCADWYGNYPNREEIDPTGPMTGTMRVCRGGSYGNNPGVCTSFCRLPMPPDAPGGGFRLCIPVQP